MRASVQARRAAGSTAVVFMIFGQEKFLIFEDEPLGLSHVRRCHALVASESDRIEPEFTFPIGVADVNVRRFAPFVRVEVESKRPDSQQCRPGVARPAQNAAVTSCW